MGLLWGTLKSWDIRQMNADVSRKREIYLQGLQRLEGQGDQSIIWKLVG